MRGRSRRVTTRRLAALHFRPDERSGSYSGLQSVNAVGIGVTAARRALDALVLVRIQDPQSFELPSNMGFWGYRPAVAGAVATGGEIEVQVRIRPRVLVHGRRAPAFPYVLNPAIAFWIAGDTCAQADGG